VKAPTSTVDECPPYPADKIYTFKPNEADFFASLQLTNPRYKDLKLCYPDLSTSVNLMGISVDPNILCDEEILLSLGKAGKTAKTTSKCLPKCKSHPKTAVCGIQFMNDDCKVSPDEYDANCLSENVADSYSIRTFNNDKKREKSGYFRFHDGACGVCSTAQDLASFMRYSFPDPLNPFPTIDTMSFLCHMNVTQTNPTIAPKKMVDEVSVCLQQGIPGVVPSAGLSPTCAYAWAINVFLTGLHENEGGCNTVCTGMLNLLLNKTCIPDTTYKCPYDPADCSLQECLQCDDRVSGAQFYELSGMTRRFAGIHTMLPRPCGELADINHTCVAKL
jgi:hypothetical protein